MTTMRLPLACIAALIILLIATWPADAADALGGAIILTALFPPLGLLVISTSFLLQLLLITGIELCLAWIILAAD